MLNVDRLLKKKSWTGAELGKLQIANVLIAYKKALESGNPNEEGVVSKFEFKKMLNVITDPIEGRVYKGYMAIHEWIAKNIQMAIAQEQQAQLQLNELWEILSNAITAEDIYSYLEELPVIMTEKQYTDLVEKRTHEILHQDGDLQIFDGNKRALQNGIAIIRPSGLGSSLRIDAETGYYKAPDIRKTLKNISLEGLFTEEERYTENAEVIEDARETFIASLYFLKAFNATLDLISSLFDIEEVSIVKRNVPHFEEIVGNFNDTIAILYKRILNTEYEDNELKEKKLKALKDILYPIDLSKTEVPKDRIERTKGYMKDFKAFKVDRYSPTNTLCMYIPNYEEEILDEEDGEGV